MSSVEIPAEARRAAESAYTEKLVELRLAEGGGFKVASQQRRAIAFALEAAAPYIRAQALLNAAETLEMAPPMLRAQYVTALRLYAAEPWRLETCPSECAANHPGREHGDTDAV